MLVLRTQRLLLRPFIPEDEDALFGFWNDPHVRRYLWDDRLVSREEVREQLALSERDFRERGYGGFMLALAQWPGVLIGFSGLRRIPGGEAVELLYGLYQNFWGRGLATEAARAVLRFGFEEAGLEEILAGADRDNTASVRVMERLGMSSAGDYYRLRREDFVIAP
ncbi:MAG TPA: GNAT family N-acetyltransferase [Archangium sp.]|jgi:RimJ/RimL family protein N-acetyltransferase|uniref:GNAT family N-acetyltransferase n=1 Tax=Archangium sp. TaxID=1872627 RepID=UPI002EDAC72C